jgi:hypothetical protein
MGEELVGMALPKAPKRNRGNSGFDAKAIGNEIAALAYVAMENGDYIYPKGVPSGNKTGAHPGINQNELMRLAGYTTKDAGREFNDLLWNKREFRQLVELYRIRRSDPMFRKEQESMLLGNILGDAMRLIAERLRYYPHSVSTREAIDVVSKLIAAQGKVSTTDPGQNDTRASDLLATLPEAQRKQALEGLKAKAEEDLSKLEAIELAHQAADDGH